MKVTPRAGGTFDVTQSFNPPTVYLDHWAVRDLTDNAAWQQRFIRALHACGGTLVLSHLVFAEFAHGDPRHAVESEQFLDRVFPTVFFASIDMKEVLRKEFRTLEGAPIAPPVDHGLTTHFVTKPVPLSFTCMISPIAKSRKLRNRSKRMSATLAAHINRVRRQPDFKQASRTFKDHVPGKPALAVFRELCRIPGTDQLDAHRSKRRCRPATRNRRSCLLHFRSVGPEVGGLRRTSTPQAGKTWLPASNCPSIL